MTPDDARRDLWSKDFYVSMNQCYHLEMKGRFEKKDRRLKIAVLNLAIAGAVFSAVSLAGIAGKWFDWLGVCVSLVAVAIAGWLNQENTSERIAYHESHLTNWGYIAQDVARLKGALEIKHSRSKSPETTPTAVLEQLQHVDETIARAEQQDTEPTDTEVLRRCYENENQRRWGVKTVDEVEAKKKRGERPEWPFNWIAPSSESSDTPAAAGT